MNTEKKTWLCWVSQQQRVVSFHEVEGWHKQPFECGAAFWLFIEAMTTEGFRIQ